jgi:hypothetical protein
VSQESAELGRFLVSVDGAGEEVTVRLLGCSAPAAPGSVAHGWPTVLRWAGPCRYRRSWLQMRVAPCRRTRSGRPLAGATLMGALPRIEVAEQGWRQDRSPTPYRQAVRHRQSTRKVLLSGG